MSIPISKENPNEGIYKNLSATTAPCGKMLETGSNEIRKKPSAKKTRGYFLKNIKIRTSAAKI